MSTLLQVCTSRCYKTHVRAQITLLPASKHTLILEVAQEMRRYSAAHLAHANLAALCLSCEARVAHMRQEGGNRPRYADPEMQKPLHRHPKKKIVLNSKRGCPSAPHERQERARCMRCSNRKQPAAAPRVQDLLMRRRAPWAGQSWSELVRAGGVGCGVQGVDRPVPRAVHL